MRPTDITNPVEDDMPETDLDQLIEFATAHARMMRANTDAGGSTPLALHAWRGGQPRMQMVVGDPKTIYDHATTIALAARADAMSLVSDTYDTLTPTNPDTGKEWERGEMAAYVAKHGYGLVSDSMTVFVAAGEQRAMVALHYSFPDGELAWGEETTTIASDDKQVGGPLVETIAEALATARREVPAPLGELDEDGQALLDVIGMCAVGNHSALAGQAALGLVAVEGSERARLLAAAKERLDSALAGDRGEKLEEMFKGLGLA